VKLGAELLVVSAGRALNATLSLFGFVVLTRTLPPEEYALIVLLTAFSSFAGLVLLNPAGQWVSRHLHEWHDQGCLGEYLSELLHLIFIVSLGVGGVAAIWYFNSGDKDFFSAIGVGAVVAGLVNFSTAALAYAAALNSLGFRSSSIFVQVAVNGFGLLFAVLLVTQCTSAIFWVLGLALGAVIAFLGARYKIQRVVVFPPTQRARLRGSFFIEQPFLLYAWPLTVVTVLMWIETSGYRFVLERVWSARELGLFLMALSVPAQLTAILESIVTQFVNPYFFRGLAGVTDKVRIGRITSAVTGTLLPLYWIWGGGLFLIAPQFLFLVAGKSYHAAAEWMVGGVLLEVARLTANAWLVSAQASKEFRPMTAPFSAGALVCILACLLVLAFDGPASAVAAGMVAAAVTKSVLVVVRARKLLPVSVPLGRVGLSALPLVLGLMAYLPLSCDRGASFSLAVLFCAGAAVLVFGSLHLRTARECHVLLQQKLD
jgi:O-antigen/teichoic acid export membrane protein